MSLGIRGLKDENIKLKQDLEKAVSIIDALHDYREFVLFSCKCDCREKILLKGDNRYEMLIKECDFLQKKTQREVVATTRSKQNEMDAIIYTMPPTEILSPLPYTEPNQSTSSTTKQERSSNRKRRGRPVSKKLRKKQEEEKASTSTNLLLPLPFTEPSQSTSSTTKQEKSNNKKRRGRPASKKLRKKQEEEKASTSTEILSQPPNNTPGQSTLTTTIKKEGMNKRNGHRQRYRKKVILEAEQAKLEGKPLPDQYVNYMRKLAERKKRKKASKAQQNFHHAFELVKQANTLSTRRTSVDCTEESKNLIEKAKIVANYAISQL